MAGSEGARDFDELALETLGRIEAEGWKALEEACRAHPEHARRLAKRVHFLSEAGLFAGPARERRAPASGADPGALPVELLSGFRLLATLGVGAMGVVYRAEELALGREVALKLVRPELLYFPGARERFEREVAIVAGLQHPGIVPVYSVGGAEGVPFFTMEYVRGVTLADVLEWTRQRNVAVEHLSGRDLARALEALAGDAGEPPAAAFAGSWVDCAVRIARDVASALEHAHARGVLHRDVKPSNVMLTRAGRAMLLDFGLSSSSTSARLTRTGVQVGSLGYMAPEAFRPAGELDARADVYALGVSLYELLTLRLPHASDWPERLARAFRSDLPPALRAQNVRVSRDLETVVATAMALERDARYPTAGDLARDLDNVLASRPVEARPAGALHRLRLWARRRPALATGLAAAVAAVTVGPSLLAWQQHRANVTVSAALDEVEAQRDRARGAQALAERNLDRASLAVETMLAHVGEEGLADVPGFEAVRRELLLEALRLQQELLSDNAESPGQRLRVARTRHRAAGIHAFLHEYAEAVAHLQGALGELEQLERADLEPALRAELAMLRAQSSFRLAEALRLLGRWDEAEPAARAAVAATLALAPEERAWQTGRSRVELAWTLGSLGQHAAARETLLEAAGDLELALGQGGDREVKRVLAKALQVLGGGTELVNVLAGARDAAQELAWLQRAVELREQVLAESGRSGDRHALGDTLNVLGTVYMGAARGPEARAVLERSAEVFGELHAEFPGVPYYAEALATAWMNLGSVARFYEERPGWSATNARAAALFGELAEAQPENPHYEVMRLYALAQVAAGGLFDGPERAGEVAAPALAALELGDALAARGVDSPAIHHTRVYTAWLAAEASLRLGAAGESRALVLRLLALEPPADFLGMGLDVVGRAQAADPAGAGTSAELAAEILRRLAALGSPPAELRAGLGAPERAALLEIPAVAELLAELEAPEGEE